MTSRSRVQQQLPLRTLPLRTLPLRRWGGPRPGAGRKPEKGARSVPHRRREQFPARPPRAAIHAPAGGIHHAAGGVREAMRRRRVSAAALLGAARPRAHDRGGWRPCGRGSCAPRSADQHCQEAQLHLASTRHGVRRPLPRPPPPDAARKHGSGQNTIDLFASGPWFDGWREEVRIRGGERLERPVGFCRTWLLRIGWRRHGLIGISEVPGGQRRAGSLRPRPLAVVRATSASSESRTVI